MKRFLSVILLMLLLSSSRGQSALEGYIEQALKTNLSLQQKQADWKSSLLALKEAHSYFLPTTWFEGQYTLAQGGRAIEIPIGDLLNPVYKTLNQLTSSNAFPTVSNAKEGFFPNNFYDTRIKTTMPILNNSIRTNESVKKDLAAIQELTVESYKRELIKEVKTAYYQYLQALNAVSIYESAKLVVQQQVRVQQALLKEGKSLPAYLSRSETELLSIEKDIYSAKNRSETAAAYLNFLLNRSLSESVIKEDMVAPQLPESVISNTLNLGNREELTQLTTTKKIQESVLKMRERYYRPQLNAFLDLGSQGFDFKVKSSSFFYLGGFQLTIPIYSGNRNKVQIETAKTDLKKIELRQAEVNQQLNLELFQTSQQLKTSYRQFQTDLSREHTAAQYYRLIEKGFKEGVNSFIELLDARNQWTLSQLQTNNDKYLFYIQLSNYNRQSIQP
ncbi:MAG: TolC family protein [Chitinophagaceae bacterium]|nr:TolC family protein [Chitinophagaceae bacterium]